MLKKILCLIALTSLSVSIQANDSADISENNLTNVEEITVISSTLPLFWYYNRVIYLLYNTVS